MEPLQMSARERDRIEVLSRVKRGELSLRQAGELLHLSYRQAKRVYRRYRREGHKGLLHGLRGRESNRKVDEKKRRAILEKYKEKYWDYGSTLARWCRWMDRTMTGSRDGRRGRC
jgi:transposase